MVVRSKNMKLEVNIDKKYFFAIILIGLIIVGIVGVVAWGTNNPINFGHSAGEIEWSQVINNITANKFCINTTSGLSCTNNWTSSSTTTGGSNWTQSGSNVYYNLGNVGIGIASPSVALQVGADTLIVNTTSRQVGVGRNPSGAWGKLAVSGGIAADSVSSQFLWTAVVLATNVTASDDIRLVNLTNVNDVKFSVSSSGNVAATGDVVANMNTWGACHDVATSANNWRTCNSGEFISGLYYSASSGSVTSFRCCKL